MHVATVLFVALEAFAWWIALRALGSAMVRDGYAVLVERLQRGGTFGDESRVRVAIRAATEASEHAVGGPSLLGVLATAFLAFFFVRWLVRQQLPVGLSAALSVAVSVLSFHVLVHLAASNDLRLWEPSSVMRMLGVGASVFGERIDVQEFIRNPGTDRVTRESLSVTTFGIIAVWVRFMVAGRGSFNYDRVLRMYGLWFGILLVTAVIANITKGVHIGSYVLMYFIFGALALAVAHGARARGEVATLGRTTPWLVSLAVTLGAVTAIGMLFGLLAFMDAGSLFGPVVDFAMGIAGRIGWLILYPFAVVMEWLFNLVFGGRTLQLEQMMRAMRDLEAWQNEQPQGASSFPAWVGTAFRAAVLMLGTWLLYRLGRVLFAPRRRGRLDEEYGELRGETELLTPGNPFGNLFRRRGDREAGAWLRRHAVYQLFARVVNEAQRRGVQRDPGDTPLEFAGRAASRLEAPLFQRIAAAFDSARYGRHYPSEEEVARMQGALGEWERGHPAPEQRRE